RPTSVDEGVTALSPPELLKSLPERCNMGLYFQIALGIAHQHTDPPHPVRLLRPRRQRPRRRAAEQRDELAPPHHSITSSVRPRSDGGTSMPSALAVFRLMINSNLVA